MVQLALLQILIRIENSKSSILYKIESESVHFNINGMPACRIQFPLQNAFALMVHKTQSETLP